MSKAAIGAVVKYCGHDGTFIADIFAFNGVNVIKANGVVTADNIKRPAANVTHELEDFPERGFWCPERGVFVVSTTQCVQVAKAEK